MSDPAELHLGYELGFEDGTVRRVDVRLAAGTLDLIKTARRSPPAWTTLEAIGCSICPLEARSGASCPVAVNLAELVAEFSDRFSYTPVTLRVTTAERVIQAQTTLQAALSSLTGLYMVTAGCPVMDKLRPMARFHLPLATEHETIYRAASMYLLAQFLSAQAGQTPDWGLGGLEEIYEHVHQVNVAIARRLREAAPKDASANALVRLDLFTDGVAHSIRDRLGELSYLFTPAYIRS